MENQEEKNMPVTDNGMDLEKTQVVEQQLKAEATGARSEQPKAKATEALSEQPKAESSPACPAPSEKKCCCSHCNTIVMAILAVAVVVLYVLHFTSAPKGKQNPKATAPIVAEGNLKIAYIDTDTLMAKYEYAIALREDNEKYQKQLENQFTNEATKLQNDYTKLQNDYQSFTQNDYKSMTLTQQNAKEEELKKRGAEIEKKMQQMQGRQTEYATKAAEKLQKDSETMTNAVYAFIREYNAANQQFDLILTKSFTSSPVLYGNPGMDITNEIVEGLNKEYKEVKSKKE